MVFNMILSAVSSLLYALVASLWVATARPRAAIMRNSLSAASIVAHGAMQLAVSFVLATIMYAALYASLVPAAEAEHALHLGLCQPPRAAAAAQPDAAAAQLAAGAPREGGGVPARVARLTFDTRDNPLLRRPSSSASLVGNAGVGTIVPPLAGPRSIEMSMRRIANGS